MYPVLTQVRRQSWPFSVSGIDKCPALKRIHASPLNGNIPDMQDILFDKNCSIRSKRNRCTCRSYSLTCLGHFRTEHILKWMEPRGKRRKMRINRMHRGKYLSSVEFLKEFQHNQLARTWMIQCHSMRYRQVKNVTSAWPYFRLIGMVWSAIEVWSLPWILELAIMSVTKSKMYYFTFLI